MEKVFGFEEIVKNINNQYYTERVLYCSGGNWYSRDEDKGILNRVSEDSMLEIKYKADGIWI